MSKKAGIVIGAVLAVIAAVTVVCIVLMGGKSEAYRSIMVYQVNGDATITRERVGEMAAYENLMLQSGDTVAVASESNMRLKLDDDKYLLAEQNTVMNIVADGDDADARTYIDLQKGSVTSEIQNKLKDGASYEVNTPNSIMAVRGTIFRVEVEPKENGDSDTKLTVFQGTVGVRAVLADGTILDEEVMVEAGEELTIDGTVTASEDLGTPTEIDYDSLPTVITEYLEELVQNGQTLAANITEKVQKAEEVQTDRIQEPQIQEAQDAQPERKDQEPELAQQDPEELKEQNPKPEAQESKTPAKPQKKQPEETQKPQEQEQNPQDPQNPALPQFDPQDPQLQDPQQPETEPQKEAPKPNVQNPTPSGDDDSPQESGGGSKKKKTQYYTVTFQYNGSTFGTQKVKKGEKATEPKLCPTQNGAWDYDFSQKVTKNIVVEWKAQ